jgi:hypothetical protein
LDNGEFPVISLPTGRIAPRRFAQIRKNRRLFRSLRETVSGAEEQNNREIIRA